MSAPIKSLASLARDAAKAETTPERRPTWPRVGRFAWLAESTAAKEILAQNKARNSQVKASEPAANRFAHLKALSTNAARVAAPVAAQQPRREAATQPRDEAAAIVARFAKVARIARGEEPAPAAHKPPAEAERIIAKMKSIYDREVK